MGSFSLEVPQQGNSHQRINLRSHEVIKGEEDSSSSHIYSHFWTQIFKEVLESFTCLVEMLTDRKDITRGTNLAKKGKGN